MPLHNLASHLSLCALQMISPLSFEQAVSARDALAKAVYGRTFTWLVEKINKSLALKVQKHSDNTGNHHCEALFHNSPLVTCYVCHAG